MGCVGLWVWKLKLEGRWGSCEAEVVQDMGLAAREAGFKVWL